MNEAYNINIFNTFNIITIYISVNFKALSRVCYAISSKLMEHKYTHTFTVWAASVLDD